jgi:ubiquinone/menaquinone biosynthesis C-methylase UbiE
MSKINIMNENNKKTVSIQHNFWQRKTTARDINHPVVSFFVNQRMQFISKFIQLNKMDTVLDVGSGRGHISKFLSENSSITATDFSSTQLKMNPIENKAVSTSELLPFEDQSFSLVNEWELLHHIPEPKKTVEEMARVAKDYLILFEPNRQNPGQFFFSLKKKEERNVLKHHKKMMYKLVQDIDFEIIECKTVGVVFPNRMPLFLLPIAKKLPFELPIIGLSNIIICKRKK